MSKAVVAYVAMGSNLGDGKTTLEMSWQTLGEFAGVNPGPLSSPYLSAPVDMTSSHWFTNCIGRLETILAPGELLQVLLDVEKMYGRVRDEQSFGHQDRSLDLDLLYYGSLSLDRPELVLPHPRRMERLFVLEPLAELEPGFIDCVTGQSVAEMLATLLEECKDGRRKMQEIARSSWES